ncbi:sulfotransferase family 2 domain-containing protein [Halomonas sp. TRM85114]|uniref:sulfotransferase family 2 domain-containing protein n=1 Tax=Halomonas jincaotanensis TaxID=2810616 RepID=UPI001BD4F2A8|nr:sulfotransferase family 2 domain-containing protein [Halomonas jincaotanensis]MBS9402918.1 sulfotransferase family 2 domain-containing protein [Halomonas jincaotanensis]
MDIEKPVHDLNSHMYISLKNRYLFHSVGKAANSTVKYFLYAEESRGTRLKYDNVHDRRASPLISPFQLSEDCLNNVLTSDKFFKFTFVRNPYSRLLSCYLDRIVPKKSTPYKELVRYLGKEIGYDVHFAEFIEAICEQSNFEQNNHWRLQYADAMCGLINYTFIGKQETFNVDMLKIWKNIYPKSKIPDFGSKNMSPSKTGSTDKVSQYWTKPLKSLVSERFEKDFHYFGYVDNN